MEHIRIKSANLRFLTELSKVRGQNIEDVLDRIVVEWAATVARKKMQQDAMPAVLQTGAKTLNAVKKTAPGKLVEMPMRTNPTRAVTSSASGSRGPAAVLSF